MKYIAQLGMWSPAADTFTLQLDLNDGALFEIAEPNGLEIAPPQTIADTVENARMHGARLNQIRYGPRTITASLIAGPAATEATLSGALREMSAMQQAAEYNRQGTHFGAAILPSAALLLQPPGSAAPFFADVLTLAFAIPGAGDGPAWVRLQQNGIELELLCAPFLRGPRITLQNELCNPGFEAPAQSGVTVFWDNFSNTNAYQTQFGAPPTAAGAQLTIAANSLVTFGSPAWDAISSAQMRFQYVAGLEAQFIIRFQNIENYICADITANALQWRQYTGGIMSSLGAAAVALSAGSWYWLSLTQFPSYTGGAMQLTAQLYTDSGNAMGALITQLTAVAAGGSAPANGVMGLRTTNAALLLGGSPLTVSLFGPGGWTFSSFGEGVCSGSWDNHNGFSGAPKQSQRAARIDFPPAGAINAEWSSYIPGQTTATAAPVEGQTAYTCSIWVNATGLSASGNITCTCIEFSATGTLLQATVTAQQTGSASGWIHLQGNITTQAQTAFAALQITAYDLTAGASAGAILLLDNAQLWQTAFAAAMPYCELRFPAAPAELLLSGIQGDVAAPALYSFGVAPAGGTLAAGNSIYIFAGRRSVAGKADQLCGTAALSNLDGATVYYTTDVTAFGGIYGSFRGAAANYAPMAPTGTAADLAGVYHVFIRARMNDTPYTAQNIIPGAYLLNEPWLGSSRLNALALYQGAAVFPFTDGTWCVADAGQISAPPSPAVLKAQLDSLWGTAYAQCASASINGMDVDWIALLPVDGETLALVLQNPTGGTAIPGWIFLYCDGLGEYAGYSAGTAWSYANAPIPAAETSGGGPGTMQMYTPSALSVGDQRMQADPRSAVNEIVVIAADTAGNPLPIYTRVEYAPLYI